MQIRIQNLIVQIIKCLRNKNNNFKEIISIFLQQGKFILWWRSIPVIVLPSGIRIQEENDCGSGSNDKMNADPENWSYQEYNIEEYSMYCIPVCYENNWEFRIQIRLGHFCVRDAEYK